MKTYTSSLLISIFFLTLSIECGAQDATEESVSCTTVKDIELMNKGIGMRRVAHITGPEAKVFVALDPHWSMPDFDDVPYRHPTDMQRARDTFQSLMQHDIDELILWKVYPGMGAAIPFSNGCAVEGYGEPDFLEVLNIMRDVARRISRRGIDHPSVRNGMERILEMLLREYQIPSLTSEASYEEKVPIMLDKIRPLLVTTTPAPSDD